MLLGLRQKQTKHTQKRNPEGLQLSPRAKEAYRELNRELEPQLEAQSQSPKKDPTDLGQSMWSSAEKMQQILTVHP